MSRVLQTLSKLYSLSLNKFVIFIAINFSSPMLIETKVPEYKIPVKYFVIFKGRYVYDTQLIKWLPNE